MKIRFLLLFFFVVPLVGGCAVRMAQLETARRFLPIGTPDPRLAAYAWELNFNGARYTVYPTEVAGRRVTFINGNSLRLEWDGESIIVIDGVPGAFGRYESGVEADARWYSRAGQPVMRATCLPKRSWRLSDRRLGWRQECSMRNGDLTLWSTHLVEFDQAGNIAVIEASMSPGASNITLRFVGSR